MNELSWPLDRADADRRRPWGVLVALPLWHRKEMILGNATGTLVIFGAAIALIVRESIALDRVTQGCLDAGFVCWPEPSAFVRYAIYAVIGLLEVFGAVHIQSQRREADPQSWLRA